MRHCSFQKNICANSLVCYNNPGGLFMKEILIATGNAHKVEEFKEMLEPLGYTIKSLKDLKSA